MIINHFSSHHNHKLLKHILVHTIIYHYVMYALIYTNNVMYKIMQVYF